MESEVEVEDQWSLGYAGQFFHVTACKVVLNSSEEMVPAGKVIQPAMLYVPISEVRDRSRDNVPTYKVMKRKKSVSNKT